MFPVEQGDDGDPTSHAAGDGSGLKIWTKMDGGEFQGAEDSVGDFQELLRTAVGAGDLTGLRFSAVTSGAKSALTIRLVDLQIRADALPGKPAASPRRWPWKPIGISLAVAAVIGAGVWAARRRRR